MSDVAQRADVALLVSDFANSDAGGKGNIIGAGVAILGFDPMNGVTSAFTIWLSVMVPSSMCPVEFSLELSLVNTSGALVDLPGPAGQVAPLRIAQIVQLDPPLIPGMSAAIRDHIGSRSQSVFNFGTGIPLAPGGLYEWKVRIDGDDDNVWSYPFAVVAGPPAPVMG